MKVMINAYNILVGKPEGKRPLGKPRPQNRSGRGGEEKHSQPLPGLELPIIQPVDQRCTAALSWLRIFNRMQEKVATHHMHCLIFSFAAHCRQSTNFSNSPRISISEWTEGFISLFIDELQICVYVDIN
jgi:hypothetical protein